jgi:folate-binding protein YgfZ
MHDNPQAISGLTFALSDHRLVCLTGRDAVAFAQAQVMSDVSLLTPGQWQWSGWLSPKGRVVALFALLKLSDEAIWLLLPDADPDALAQALRRFVFRSKVTIASRQDLHVAASFEAPAHARGAIFSGDEGGGIELDMGGDAGPRSLTIAPSQSLSTDSAAVGRWRAFDLMHGLPRLPASQIEQWTPQQLSLDRLAAFSVKKGCYPGQEIVARTHFLGQAKRGLALLEGNAPLAAGTDVSGDAGAAIGKLVASADADGRHLALAVLPLAHGGQSLGVAGMPARELPLLGGLVR